MAVQLPVNVSERSEAVRFTDLSIGDESVRLVSADGSVATELDVQADGEPAEGSLPVVVGEGVLDDEDDDSDG